MSQTNNINIHESINFEHIINKINLLGKESDKNDFIKNYQDVKAKISVVDNILENKSQLNQDLTIDKLFEMLEEYNEILEKSSEYLNLDIQDFKKVKDIIDMIENKLNDKINIIEIK